MASQLPRPFAVPLMLVLALSLAGCARITGPREWTATAELVAGGTFVVDVRDTSGRIDEVEIDPAGTSAPAGVSNPAGQANVLLVPWTGGACDRRTDIAIAANGTGLAISFATTVAPGVCDAIGVAHVLRITSGQPLPAAAITVTTAPPTSG